MDLGLAGKVAMVAGASRGLGYAVARALAAEGARVSMLSRDPSAIREAVQRIEAETGGRRLPSPATSAAEAIVRWYEAPSVRWYRSSVHQQRGSARPHAQRRRLAAC
jgi:NAD(P)-dependent dehydrogenase (short-subunit alcohol dehydrogenase family)